MGVINLLIVSWITMYIVHRKLPILYRMPYASTYNTVQCLLYNIHYTVHMLYNGHLYYTSYTVQRVL